MERNYYQPFHLCGCIRIPLYIYKLNISYHIYPFYVYICVFIHIHIQVGMCMHACIYIYVSHIYCVRVAIYISTNTRSSSHSPQTPDMVRQASSASLSGKWQPFLLRARLSLITSLSIAFCGQLWLQCGRELRFLSGHVQAQDLCVEELLHGTRAHMASCPHRRPQGPPSPRQPPLLHPPGKLSPQIQECRQICFEGNTYFPYSWDAFQSNSWRSIFVSRSSSTTNFIRRLFWRICFSRASCLLLLAAPHVHSMFLPCGLSKHICSGSYVMKYSKQTGEACADSDSQISPHHRRSGNKTCTWRAHSHQGSGDPTPDLWQNSEEHLWVSSCRCWVRVLSWCQSHSWVNFYWFTSLEILALCISCPRLPSDVQLS